MNAQAAALDRDLGLAHPTPGRAAPGTAIPARPPTSARPLAAAPSADTDPARTQTATVAALALAAGVALFAAMVVTLLLTASTATHLSDADLANEPAAVDAQLADGH